MITMYNSVTEMKGSIKVGPFQTEILERKFSQAHMCNTHVMVVPIGHAEVKKGRAHQLPPGLQVLHAYTTLTAGSKQVSIVVQNMTENAIFLKNGVWVAHIVSGWANTKGTYDSTRETRKVDGEIES